MREFRELVVSESETLYGLTFDVEASKNYNSYISSYNIPVDETVLVYGGKREGSDGSLTGAGPMITEEAIYIHSSRLKSSNVGRIPLSDICGYLVYETAGAGVKLFGTEKEYQIFVATRSESPSTARGLVSLLHSLQKTMLVKKDDKMAYVGVLKRACSMVRRQLRVEGVLDDDFRNILKVMEQFPEFKNEAVFLLLEDAYRRGNREVYDLLLEQKSPLLNEDNIRVLKHPDEIFSYSYVMDLADAKSFTNVRAIIDAYLTFKSAKTLTLKEAQILMYLCIRMEDYDYFSELLELVGEEMDKEDLWSLMATRSGFKNHKVNKLQVKVAGFGEPSQEELLATTDLGLCSIHYALMMRNKDIIRYILPRCDWSLYKSPVSRERMCDVAYDPLFVAAYIFKDETILRDVFIHTSPKSKALNRSIQGMDAMIDINVSLKKKYPQNRDEYQERIDEYRAMRREMKAERKKMARAEVKRYKKLAQIVEESHHPLCDFLLKLYSSQETFLNWLSAGQGNGFLSKYKKVFFVSPEGCRPDLSYAVVSEGKVTETFVSENDNIFTGNNKTGKTIFDNPVYQRQLEQERKKAKEKEKRRREFFERVKDPLPYVGSWFSKQAHENIRVLKEEYRILVKKYHPDSSGDNKTTDMLLRIMAERADILESMRRAGNG